MAAAVAPIDEAARDRRVESMRRSSNVACAPARRFNSIRTGAGLLCAPCARRSIRFRHSRSQTSCRRGSAGSVWIARHEGRTLAFEVRDGEILELESGSTFDLLGSGQSGALEGIQFVAPPQLTSFWFSWVHFYPESRLPGESE